MIHKKIFTPVAAAFLAAAICLQAAPFSAFAEEQASFVEPIPSSPEEDPYVQNAIEQSEKIRNTDAYDKMISGAQSLVEKIPGTEGGTDLETLFGTETGSAGDPEEDGDETDRSGLDQARSELLQAMNTLRDMGISPIMIVRKIRGKDPSGKEQTSLIPESVSDAAESLTNQAADTAMNLAQDAGTQVIDGVKAEAKEQADNFLESLLESIRQAIRDTLESAFDRIDYDL